MVYYVFMKMRNIFKLTLYPAYIAHARHIFRQIHKDATASYAQEGEDIIVLRAFKHLKILKPTYLDIGAHHPTILSNTYLFYREGFRGVCVEPNPKLVTLFQKLRPRDTVLAVAVGTTHGKVMLNMISDASLSTTSTVQAKYFSGLSKHTIENKIIVPQVTITEILQQYFTLPPDFVSIDIEGMDFEVLKTFNLDTFRPPIFCIETLTYDEYGNQRKLENIIIYMNNNDYFLFADTYVNTIFIDQRIWKKIQNIKKDSVKTS